MSESNNANTNEYATVLGKVKTALRLTSDDEDLEDELLDLIQECISDLIPADVDETNIDLTDPLILKAVKTYCKLNFGQPDDYDRLKASYDELKKQLGMDSRYTNYGGE